MPSLPLCKRVLANHGRFSLSGCQAQGFCFICTLGSFQASAFHPFIEPVVKILKSKKRIRISWEKKGGHKNLQPLFC